VNVITSFSETKKEYGILKYISGPKLTCIISAAKRNSIDEFFPMAISLLLSTTTAESGISSNDKGALVNIDTKSAIYTEFTAYGVLLFGDIPLLVICILGKSAGRTAGNPLLGSTIRHVCVTANIRTVTVMSFTRKIFIFFTGKAITCE
jgi:hypothetical protein